MTYKSGDRVRATGTGSNYHGCTGTVIRDAAEAGVEVRWDSVPHEALPIITLHSHAYIEPEPRRMQSGDLCRFIGHGEVEHYRCDDYRGGTVTDCIRGGVVKQARFDAPRGFDR